MLKLNNKGEFMLLPGFYLGKWAIGFICATIAMSSASYLLRSSHRERKAVDLCYCQMTTGDEYYCKSEEAVGKVETVDGAILDSCVDYVKGMSKEEVLDYIKDDNVMPVTDNYGVF